MTKLGVVAAVVLAVLGCGVGLGQTQDSETLQAILTEMRGMHNDVRLSQTTQILLAEMLMQRGVVDKAMQKRDDLRTGCRRYRPMRSTSPRRSHRMKTTQNR